MQQEFRPGAGATTLGAWAEALQSGPIKPALNATTAKARMKFAPQRRSHSSMLQWHYREGKSRSIDREGGAARASKLSPEQRREIASRTRQPPNERGPPTEAA